MGFSREEPLWGSFPGNGGSTETVNELRAGEILFLMSWWLATMTSAAVATAVVTTASTITTIHM